MTDLLQEVDDMMRQERLAKIWHNHGNFIIGAIVAIILATAAFSGIKSWNAHVRTQQTEKLMAALDENNFTEKAPEIAADLRPGLKTVALLTAAGKHLEEEKPEEALILFKQIAGDKSTPRDLAGFAVIMEARLNKNEGNKQDILAALENIYRSSASPWRFHAALEAAVLKASADNYAGARDALKTVLGMEADEAMNLPPGLMERARALDHIYAMKQETKSDTPAAQEG